MAQRVLVIDDNLELASNLADILEGAAELGVEVVCSSEGQSGLAEARRGGFDVAIVDVKLPDGSGVELVPLLRAASPFGEVLVITGAATIDAAVAALRGGAFAFVLKSFRPEELISTVEQALAKVALKRDREGLERRYRALVEAADVLIVGLDAAGRVTLANPRLTQMTGDGPDASLGAPFAEKYIAAEDRERFEQAAGGVRTGDKAIEVEAGLTLGAKGIRRIRWHLSGVSDPRGRPDLVYGIGIDVTERRALERRAASAEALSAMGSLALGLAHEIRNPLNAAVLQLHLLSRAVDRLAEDEPRSSMRSRVAIIDAEMRRLERMLTEFLELARPRGLRREPVDLGKLAREVLEFHQEVLNMRHIELATDIGDACIATGDQEKLRQVFINLVVNALDAMPESGTLTVRVSAHGASALRFSVGDTGPGIDPLILPDIFDPFFTTKEAGTGLGLSIVRKVVDQHGGKVAIESAPGSGTTVTIELPA